MTADLREMGAAVAAALRDSGAVAVDLRPLEGGGFRVQAVDEAYLSPAEVAEVLGVTPRTVCEWAERGRLSYLRGPGRKGLYRFEVGQLRRDLRRLTKEARRIPQC